MNHRKDRYEILDRERMPWGTYSGKRISKVPVEYCKRKLQDPSLTNPYLRDLLKLRVEQDKNWLKDLQKDLRHYRDLSEHLEKELENSNAVLRSVQLEAIKNVRAQLEPVLRRLRRNFASKYHPDTKEGSAEMMAMVNQIFNELEKEIRSPNNYRGGN